jgi:hypothetical protein
MGKKIISFRFKGKTPKEKAVALAILRPDLSIGALEKLAADLADNGSNSDAGAGSENPQGGSAQSLGGEGESNYAKEIFHR